MSSRLVYRTCAWIRHLVSGECLRGYKPRAVDCSRLAPRVAASCRAKPSCYTWPACRYLCCPAWQLVDCVLANAFVICVICVIKNYFTLYFTCVESRTTCVSNRVRAFNAASDTAACDELTASSTSVLMVCGRRALPRLRTTAS